MHALILPPSWIKFVPRDEIEIKVFQPLELVLYVLRIARQRLSVGVRYLHIRKLYTNLYDLQTDLLTCRL